MPCCKKRDLTAATTRDDGSSSSSMAPEDPLRRALSAARCTVRWRRNQVLRAVQQGRPAPTDHSSGGGVFPSSSQPSRGAGEEEEDILAAGDIERRLEAVLGRFKKQLQAEQSTARTRRFEQYGSFLVVPEADAEEPRSTLNKRAALPQKEATEAGGFSSCWNPTNAGRCKRVFAHQHPASAGGRGSTLVRCPRPLTGASTTTNGGKGDGAALEKRLEAALGDHRRKFESGKIIAGNLGAMFGQYGTFL